MQKPAANDPYFEEEDDLEAKRGASKRREREPGYGYGAYPTEREHKGYDAYPPDHEREREHKDKKEKKRSKHRDRERERDPYAQEVEDASAEHLKWHSRMVDPDAIAPE